jgi:hypothetical protein
LENTGLSSTLRAAVGCLLQKEGVSPNAQLLLEVYQWSVEEGDLESAALLWEELQQSGKAQYLTALASPSC